MTGLRNATKAIDRNVDERQYFKDKVKKDCPKSAIDVKKSELLRAGVAPLRDLDTDKLQALVSQLSPLKIGCLKKSRQLIGPRLCGIEGD